MLGGLPHPSFPLTYKAIFGYCCLNTHGLVLPFGILAIHEQQFGLADPKDTALEAKAV
jgi:hypothetical protein